MIVYQLKCTDGHQFEAWFCDGATYEKQNAAGDVECPVCGDSHISKAPMAPRLVKSRDNAAAGERGAAEVAREFLQAAERLRREVEEKCEYVGDRFAEEARRIHYGETDERGIYGEATGEEAGDLHEEGIKVFRMPRVRRDN